MVTHDEVLARRFWFGCDDTLIPRVYGVMPKILALELCTRYDAEPFKGLGIGRRTSTTATRSLDGVS